MTYSKESVRERIEESRKGGTSVEIESWLDEGDKRKGWEEDWIVTSCVELEGDRTLLSFSLSLPAASSIKSCPSSNKSWDIFKISNQNISEISDKMCSEI